MPVRQPSRKGKKAWRKNVDVSEVSKGLEQVWGEIIQGGVIKEKTDAQLFSLDTKGDGAVAKKLGKKLKCDEILSSRSAIPAVTGRKAAVSAVDKKKRRGDWLPRKEIARLKDVASGVKRRADEEVAQVGYDLWGGEEVGGRLGGSGFEFLEPPQAVKEPKTLKFAPVSLALTGKAVPAVRVPEAGISYNPVFEEWDSLLRLEGEKEVEVERKRLAEVAEVERIEALAAMSDVEEGEEEEEEVVVESGHEGVEKIVTKRPERKTQAQRNKIARRKEMERKRTADLKAKRQSQQLAVIKKYAKNLDAKQLERVQKRLNVEDDDKNPKLMRKWRFGKTALPRAPLELQLPDELASSLRTLKPEGSLLRDRLRSVRERGLVDTRLRAAQRKSRKLKVTERWTYKDFK